MNTQGLAGLRPRRGGAERRRAGLRRPGLYAYIYIYIYMYRQLSIFMGIIIIILTETWKTGS